MVLVLNSAYDVTWLFAIVAVLLAHYCTSERILCSNSWQTMVEPQVAGAQSL